MSQGYWDWTRPTVTAIVSEEKKPYYIHPDVLSRMSPAWDSRLDGYWKGDERHIDWSEFDHQTIKCALNYFYTGHYDPEKAGTGSQSSIEQNNEDGELNGAMNFHEHKPSTLPVNDSVSLPLLNENGHGSSVVTSEVDVARSAVKSSPIAPATVILAHCRVYTFANQFFCEPLKRFALQRIDRLLRLPHLKSSRILPSLTEAVHHIYDQTQRHESTTEPARDIFIHFLAQNLEQWDGYFETLIGNEEIMADLLPALLKRATTAEERLAASSAEKDATVRDLQATQCKRCISLRLRSLDPESSG